MAETNNCDAEVQANESNYLKAERLIKAIRCLLRDKEKADIYENAAKIYKSLGNYKDSPELFAQYTKKAAEHRKLAEEYEKKEANNAIHTVTETSKKERKNIFLRPRFIAGLLILIILVCGIIYVKTESGRYHRASFYEKIGNYEKSYKMFDNLKTYQDSEDRSIKCHYKYAEQCVADKEYDSAKKAYRLLGDYKDSEEKLAFVEIEIIKKTKTGGNILFGGYHWLIADKKEDKVLLVKSQPINGFAYDEKGGDVTWQNSSLRAFLNNEFLHEIFTDSMIQSILDTEVTVPDSKKYGTVGGNSTIDKIFLLNAKQFNQYSDILSNYLRTCWLINPGNSQSTAQFVSYGTVMDYGYDVTDTNIHIRPALWVSVK